MFEDLKEAMEDGRKRGEAWREKQKEEYKEAKQRRENGEKSDFKKSRLGGEGIIGQAKEVKKHAKERSERALELVEEFREFEYEHTGGPHPQRYEYETHLVEMDFLVRNEDFLNFRAAEGWQLVRTYTKDDLGLDSAIGDTAEMYMVFERPVDPDDQEDT